MVCKKGQKPKVIYQFQDGKEKIFHAKVSPIDVQTQPKPVDATENYRQEGYTIYFYSTNNYSYAEWIVKDYYIDEYPNNSFQFRYAIRPMFCGSNIYTTGVNIDPSTLRIDYSKKCPETQNKKCSIIVLHNGKPIFKDQGNCPCTYKVQCGNCPDGFLECKTNKYPGYCCLPCKDIVQSINNLADRIRV